MNALELPDRVSLNRHLNTSGAPDKLRHLINDIARAGKYIQFAIRTTEAGLAGSSNSFGEEQLNLDVLSNTIVADELKESRIVKGYTSEEEANIQEISEDGLYYVAFDPLDGSSLVETNLSIGSIFGIYSEPFIGLTPGKQVGALYIVYGPRTILIYSIGKGVHMFYLNDVGEFLLLKENLTIGEKGKTYSPGNLRAVTDTPNYRALMNHWLDAALTLRYSGGMVPDIHHILIKGGGIFANIGGNKYPNGKLRLLYECGPFAYIVEQAGGLSSNGTISILDVEIKDIDQRTPLIVGSKQDVEHAVNMLSA